MYYNSSIPIHTSTVAEAITCSKLP